MGQRWRVDQVQGSSLSLYHFRKQVSYRLIAVSFLRSTDAIKPTPSLGCILVRVMQTCWCGDGRAELPSFAVKPGAKAI